LRGLLVVRIPLYLNSLVGGLVRPLIYGKTSKYEFEGSTHLKNIPTNSSGDGVVSGGSFFFRMFDVKDWG